MIDNLTALAARDKLLHIAARWPRLAARLNPTRTPGARVTGTRTPPLPIDVHISDLMHEIETNVARFYAAILADETDWEPTTSAMPQLLREVAMRYGHFTTGDDAMAQGFCDDAETYDTKVTRALERPAPPTYIGPCQAGNGIGEDGCAGELYVRDGETAGKCRTCGAAFTIAEQRTWLDQQMQERLMTLAEIGRALKILGTPVPPGTIRRWASEGKLKPARDDEPTLYRLADVHARTLATARHTHQPA